MMNKDMFLEFAIECGAQTAIDLAEANGVEAVCVHRWLDELVNILAEVDQPFDIDEGFGVHPIWAEADGDLGGFELGV